MSFGISGFVFHNVLFFYRLICLCVTGLIHVCLAQSLCCTLFLCVIDTVHSGFTTSYILSAFLVFCDLFFRILFMWERTLNVCPLTVFTMHCQFSPQIKGLEAACRCVFTCGVNRESFRF